MRIIKTHLFMISKYYHLKVYLKIWQYDLRLVAIIINFSIRFQIF
jgi:hypothetical protein